MTGGGGEAAWPDPVMTLDHVFVLARPWRVGQSGTRAADELAAGLEAVGFRRGSSRRHPGQGTENRCFAFEGFVLELLAVVCRAEAEDPRVAPLSLPARLDQPGASPFGIASRPTRAARPDPDYPHVVYRPSYLPPPLGIPVARDVPVSEPLWFHLPFGTSRSARERYGEPAHPNGARRLGALALATPAPLGSRSASIAAALGIDTRADADAHRLTLRFEGETLADDRFEPHARLPLTIDCRRTTPGCAE